MIGEDAMLLDVSAGLYIVSTNEFLGNGSTCLKRSIQGPTIEAATVGIASTTSIDYFSREEQTAGSNQSQWKPRRVLLTCSDQRNVLDEMIATSYAV